MQQQRVDACSEEEVQPCARVLLVEPRPLAQQYRVDACAILVFQRMLLVFELFALLLFCHPRSACEETIKGLGFRV